MCGRYVSPDEAAYEREWSHIPRLTNIFQSFNVAPTQLAPIIRLNNGERELDKVTWGFQPNWAKSHWINARSETVFEKRAFKASARRNRCLVLAAGWYEWSGNSTPKQPYYFTRVDDRSFAFAGIYTSREVPTGKRFTFAILTTAANELAAPIHHRMPVILHPRDYDTWLDTASEFEQLSSAIERPFDDGLLQTYPVSRFVNRPGNDAPECIKRVAIN